MSTAGDTLSTVKDVKYWRGFSVLCTVEGFRYCGGIPFCTFRGIPSVLWRETTSTLSITVMSISVYSTFILSSTVQNASSFTYGCYFSEKLWLAGIWMLASIWWNWPGWLCSHLVDILTLGSENLHGMYDCMTWYRILSCDGIKKNLLHSCMKIIWVLTMKWLLKHSEVILGVESQHNLRPLSQVKFCLSNCLIICSV